MKKLESPNEIDVKEHREAHTEGVVANDPHLESNDKLGFNVAKSIDRLVRQRPPSTTHRGS